MPQRTSYRFLMDQVLVYICTQGVDYSRQHPNDIMSMDLTFFCLVCRYLTPTTEKYH